MAGCHMRELISEIFAVEEEGRRLLSEARARADSVVADAKKKAAELSAASLAAAREEAARVLNEALAEAEREKAALLAAAAAEAERELSPGAEKLRAAARLAADRVLGK